MVSIPRPDRFIYGEAISALPMNGGAYNVLINTTSKSVASFAACLAIISYIATGVVSAATAVSYLQVRKFERVWMILGRRYTRAPGMLGMIESVPQVLHLAKLLHQCC